MISDQWTGNEAIYILRCFPQAFLEELRKAMSPGLDFNLGSEYETGVPIVIGCNYVFFLNTKFQRFLYNL